MRTWLGISCVVALLGAPDARALSPPPPLFQSARVLQPLHEGDVAMVRVRSYCRLAAVPARVLRDGARVVLVARNGGQACAGVHEYDLPLGSLAAGSYTLEAAVCFEDCGAITSGESFGPFGVQGPRAIPALGVPALVVLAFGLLLGGAATRHRHRPAR